MGCDYYIIKQLEVTHLNENGDSSGNENGDGNFVSWVRSLFSRESGVEEISYIEIKRERAYFAESDDANSEDTEVLSDSARRHGKYLQVTYQPRVLFENGHWKNARIRDKYTDFITNQINNRCRLIKVVKTEVRYARG